MPVFTGLQVLGVAVGVCVPVVRPGALSVCCVAGFALCAAVGVCAVVCAAVLFVCFCQ